jgi:gamma-glutamylputrescine oxidase
VSLLERDQALARDCVYALDAGPPLPALPPLQGQARCDVAIVGGGLAGLSAALELAARGLDVRLLEAQRLGSGASGRNGGQAIHGLACEMEVLEAQLGPADARRAWDMTLQALDLLHERMATHRIDAEWQSGFLGVATSPGKARALQSWADRLAQQYAYPLRRIPRAELRQWVDSPRYHAAVHDPRSGHLHPLKYLRGLARAAAAAGAQLHEHSAVQRLVPGPRPRLHTASGVLDAAQVLLAGNVHGADLPGTAGLLDARVMPVGTYIACTAPLAPTRLAGPGGLIPDRSAVCDTDLALDYFRPTADHRLLYGGLVSYSTRAPRQLAQRLRRRLEATFPQLRGVPIAHAWGGFVDVTLSRAPHFGRLPAAGGAAANVYFVQGFSGHGLALTGMAGRLVAEAMTGDAARFDVFARLSHRPFPGGRALRMPALVLAMGWSRLRDMLG